MNKPTINTTKTSPSGGNIEGTLRNIILVTAIFSVVVSILMLFNYIQLTTNDPIESSTLTALTQLLADDPNNEQLKEEIRAFDLMARKAYFTSQWQIQTGAWLLVIGAVILVISLRYYFNITSKIERPDDDAIPNQKNRILTSKWLLSIGATTIVLAIISSFLSIDHLKKYDVSAITTANLSTEDDPIQLVDLREAKVEEKAENTAEIAAAISSEETPTSASEAEVVAAKVEESPAKVNNNSKFPGIKELQAQVPGFRGALGQGVYQVKNTPIDWDVASGKNVLWKTKVPISGFNSPVIWNNKLLLSGANQQERWVYCYDINSGKLLWQKQADNITGSPATAPKTTDDTGLAASSLTTNGLQVVAIFGTGDIIAFDMEGNRLWAKNLGVPDNHYGHSSSLISWQEKIIIQYDTNKGARLIALNITTGESIWETKRSSHISWASPIIADVDGKMQVITSAEPSVAGFDIETGAELWKVDCMMGEVGPSPAFGNGLVVAANEYATLACINPKNGSKVWESSDYLPEVASPVVADGLLIIATTYSVIACYDIHTGNQYWETEYNDGFYSSPVVADGKIYAADMNGTVHILKLDRELSRIADVAMGEKIMTTPVFTNGKMYIRGMENLYCIGK